ncbi:MAG TPA: TetR/AcrR family transcriptional regulator [Acidimicrobiia bacterium]|nr:TetR/AcrR family transcriptional regulator [Acidimicrobiia bacterium]
MPRPFAESERELLKQKLRAVARQRIEEAGVRAMSIADLTRQVGVSKGAFYLLYESKDQLVMEVLGEVEEELRTTLSEVAGEREGTTVAVMTRVVRSLFDAVGNHPVLALLADPDEGPHIFRMVPPDEMEERMADDDRWFAGLAADLQADGVLAPDVGDDILAGIARLALTVRRDPDLRRHRYLVDILCESLGARLGGDGR